MSSTPRLMGGQQQEVSVIGGASKGSILMAGGGKANGVTKSSGGLTEKHWESNWNQGKWTGKEHHGKWDGHQKNGKWSEHKGGKWDDHGKWQESSGANQGKWNKHEGFHGKWMDPQVSKGKHNQAKGGFGKVSNFNNGNMMPTTHSPVQLMVGGFFAFN